MKKKMVLFSAISLAFVGALAFVLLKGVDMSKPLRGTPYTEYQITLNEGNAPALEASYGKEGEANIITKGDYTLNMKYRLAKNEDGKHVTLAPHGVMFNDPDETTYANRVTGLESITVTYTSDASISIRTSIRNDGKEYGAPQLVTSGTPLVFEDKPYYFILEAGDAAAQISSITLAYSCSENAGLYLMDLAGEYTGYGNDGYAYKLTLEGANATIKSLNKPVEETYAGSVEISEGRLVCTFTANEYVGHYVASVSNDHRILSYYSKDGIAAGFAEIDFYKVYKVENFESYTKTGNAFGGQGRTGADSLYSMSGLRSQYVADWYTNGSNAISYFGVEGSYAWRVMGSNDFLTYSGNLGHNSSKVGIFKGNNNGLRYTQMKAAFGLPNIIGKGSYLSFWAKPFTNTTGTVKAGDTSIKINAFYNQKVTASNIGTKTYKDITILGGSDWTRYVVELDPSKDYYSFGLYDNKSSQVYLAIDDVEIYTVDPYNPINYNELYLRGTAVSGWDVDDNYKLSEPADPTANQAEILDVHLKVGDFKIANYDYSKAWGWDNMGEGEGAANFEAGAENNNIHCNVEGDYDVYLANNHKIYFVYHAPAVDPDALYIRGSAANGWDEVSEVYKSSVPQDENNQAEFLNVHLTVGDFKIANYDWSKEWNVNNWGGGAAADHFEAGASDNNIHCKVEFNYNIYLTKNHLIYFELVPAPYPEGSFKGGAIVDTGTPATFEMVIAFGNEDNGLIAVRLSNADAVATGVTYDENTAEFTITTTGSYQSVATYGNITGRYDYVHDKLVDVACDGTISAYVTNNGSIEASRLDVFDCDGTTSELQQQFKRRYMSGSWQVDNTNADRITSNTTEFVSGTGSVKRRGYSGGAVALNFMNDFNPSKSVLNIQYWVYNPSANDISLRMWVYKSAGLSNNAEQGSVIAKAGQWTYCAMGLCDGTNPLTSPIYNIQIADFNNTGVYLSFDNIALF